MSARRRWLWAGAVALLTALVLGRWLAVSTADRLWAHALGVAAFHARVASLRVQLLATALVGAGVWCIGNLILVYRAIGSVHVPRRLGNLEIVEAVPRKYLRLGAILLGLAVAISTTHTAGSWWHVRMLTDVAVDIGLRDPILEQDASYYLFHLPWERTLHSYATLLAGVMLGMTIVLYTAVGGIRWTGRRLHVNEFARQHLGGVLAVFALVLVWGYRLEPAEYVAGVHNVPFDSVLTDIRMPTARVLSALGLIAALVSLLWIWFGRVSLVAFGWIALATFSFVGHYIVPAVAAGVRSETERLPVAVVDAQREFVSRAYGLAIEEVPLGGQRDAAPEAPTELLPALQAAPVWDGFAVAVLLNRVARERPYYHFADVALAQYRAHDGAAVPVLLGVREVNLEAARELNPELSWEQVHLVPYGHGQGVVAVLANRSAPDGLPLFVDDPRQPTSAVAEVVDVSLDRPQVMFGPTMREFAIAPEAVQGEAVGVRLGGVVRRLALAWKLQSPQLLTSPSVSPRSMVLWYRAVTERLERYAPFAEFGAPYPVVVDGELYWLAPGYVVADTYPLSRRIAWRGGDTRYLRVGFTGVVHGRTGETAVFLVPEPDSLSAAWAAVASDVVEPADAMPEPLRHHRRYPRELFDIQLAVLRGPDDARRFRVLARGSGAEGVRSSGEPYWWIGSSPADSVPRLRIRSVLERGEPPGLDAIVEGVLSRGTATLRVFRPGPGRILSGPGQAAPRLAAERGTEEGIPGPVKTIPVGGRVLYVQSIYGGGDGTAPPRLMDVLVAWDDAVGRGQTLEAALAGARVTARPTADWAAARRWFERLDAARRSGDWMGFGEAYGQLQRLLGARSDSVP